MPDGQLRADDWQEQDKEEVQQLKAVRCREGRAPRPLRDMSIEQNNRETSMHKWPFIASLLVVTLALDNPKPGIQRLGVRKLTF
jgi:hypothetical protein